MKKFILALAMVASLSSFANLIVTNETIITTCPTNELQMVTNTIMHLSNGLVFTNYNAHALRQEALNGKDSPFDLTPDELADYREIMLLTTEIEKELHPGYSRKSGDGWYGSGDTANIKVGDIPANTRFRKVKRPKKGN